MRELCIFSFFAHSLSNFSNSEYFMYEPIKCLSFLFTAVYWTRSSREPLQDHKWVWSRSSPHKKKCLYKCVCCIWKWSASSQRNVKERKKCDEYITVLLLQGGYCPMWYNECERTHTVKVTPFSGSVVMMINTIDAIKIVHFSAVFVSLSSFLSFCLYLHHFDCIDGITMIYQALYNMHK